MRRIVLSKGKFGQVWVETVIYTLIGLVLLGVVLAVSKPKIEEMKDRAIIEQTIKSLNEINSKIYEIQNAGVGNKRIVEMGVSKGEFFVDLENNEIGWDIDSNYKYSELDRVLFIGDMEVITKLGSPYLVRFSTGYGLDIISGNEDGTVKFSNSPVPYKFVIENRGDGVLDISAL